MMYVGKEFPWHVPVYSEYSNLESGVIVCFVPFVSSMVRNNVTAWPPGEINHVLT